MGQSLEENRKQRRAARVRSSVEEAVNSGRFLIGIFWVDHSLPEPLRMGFHTMEFPYADFAKANREFRDFLSAELKKRDAKEQLDEEGPDAEEREED